MREPIAAPNTTKYNDVDTTGEEVVDEDGRGLADGAHAHVGGPAGPHEAGRLDLGDDLEAIVTYDERLAGAAATNGIRVAAPT